MVEGNPLKWSTIAIAGVGLATSQLASAVILTQDQPNSKVSTVYRLEVFSISLLIGVSAALLTLIILRIYRR